MLHHSPGPSLLNSTLIFSLSHGELLKFFPLLSALQSSNTIRQLLTGHLPWLLIRCLPGKEFPPMPYHFCNPSSLNGNTVYPGASARILGFTDSSHVYPPKEPLICHWSISYVGNILSSALPQLCSTPVQPGLWQLPSNWVNCLKSGFFPIFPRHCFQNHLR